MGHYNDEGDDDYAHEAESHERVSVALSHSQDAIRMLKSHVRVLVREDFAHAKFIMQQVKILEKLLTL
jgi:hypothetical protein